MSNTFGVRVRNELWKRNMKAKDLARMLSISEAYLSDILNGKREGEEQKKRIRYVLDMDGDSDESN